MDYSFKNKIVLVTGGSRGIGLNIAKSFYENGAGVYITSTKKDFYKVGKNKNNFIKTIISNFNEDNKLKELIRKINEINKIDILVNNAGVNKIGEINNYKEEDWDFVQQVNIKSPFLILKAVSKKMRKNKYGRIINISSIFGSISKAKRASYSTSKFALLGLTKASALDLADQNILVNAVSPGFVNTELTKRILKGSELEKIKKQIPLKRLAESKDISNVVLFLASEKNTYITAQNIIVDGGFTSI